MQANVSNESHSDKKLFPEQGNMAFSLHSKYTVFRRMLHTLCLGIAIYAIAFASVQFNALSRLQPASVSGFGQSESHLQLAKNMANLIAVQWASPILQDPVEKDVLVQQWAALDNIIYVGVFSQSGQVQRQTPKNSTIKSLTREYPHSIVASAPFSNEKESGYVVIVSDNQAFNQLQTRRNRHLTHGVIACLILGLVGGAYLFRSFRQLKPKTRQ